MNKTQKSLVDQLKSLLPILAIVALLGGFYYTTQYRLQALETKVDEMSNKIQQISRRLTQIKKQIKNN
jgi:hypothetical protein